MKFRQPNSYFGCLKMFLTHRMQIQNVFKHIALQQGIESNVNVVRAVAFVCFSAKRKRYGESVKRVRVNPSRQQRHELMLRVVQNQFAAVIFGIFGVVDAMAKMHTIATIRQNLIDLRFKILKFGKNFGFRQPIMAFLLVNQVQ